MKIIQRSEQGSVKGQLEQSWKEKEDKFRKFYKEKLGPTREGDPVDDNGYEEENQSDLGLVEEDINIQSDQEGAQNDPAELIPIDIETEPEIV